VRISVIVLAALAGCAQPGLAGMSPVRPAWPGYPSVHPELRWEPLAAESLGERFVIEDVRYDLRVCDDRSVLYSVEGLTEPRHRVDMELRRGKDYWWTVRARFRLNGAPRRTDWIQDDFGGARDAHLDPPRERLVPLKIAPP
jgi:hypothetical protein